MCSLILAWQVFADAPVVVAANRDEALGRPSTAPRRWDTDPVIVAPRDEDAGGTWLGYNDHGVLVAITNRWVDLEGERSRGLLVRDALGAADAASAVETVRDRLSTDQYAGFNLVIADAESATYLEWDGDLRVTDLEPGVHVVVNQGIDDESAKSMAILEALPDTATGEAVAWLDAVEPVLTDHDLETCVHGDGFGTRSASLIALPAADAETGAVYRFADGPPCETAFVAVEGQV